jgi:hypothetical protein
VSAVSSEGAMMNYIIANDPSLQAKAQQWTKGTSFAEQFGVDDPSGDFDMAMDAAFDSLGGICPMPGRGGGGKGGGIGKGAGGSSFYDKNGNRATGSFRLDAPRIGGSWKGAPPTLVIGHGQWVGRDKGHTKNTTKAQIRFYTKHGEGLDHDEGNAISQAIARGELPTPVDIVHPGGMIQNYMFTRHEADGLVHPTTGQLVPFHLPNGSLTVPPGSSIMLSTIIANSNGGTIHVITCRDSN